MRPERGQRLEPRDRVPDAAIRSELENVLASELFSRSERLSALLRFVVEETLEGRGDILKEAVIAHQLYGKDADFDGAGNPIVRVDARRLRDKLREYYADATADPVVISLPKGSYVPAFELTAGAASAADIHLSPVRQTAGHRVSWFPCGCFGTRPARRRMFVWRGAALALGMLALAAGGYAALSLRSTASAGRIMLAVMPSQNLTGDPEQEYLSDGLTEELIAVLGGVNSSRLGIIARTSAMHYKNSSKRADEIGNELGVDYLLETSLRRIGDRVLIRQTVRLAHPYVGCEPTHDSRRSFCEGKGNDSSFSQSSASRTVVKTRALSAANSPSVA